MTVSALSRRRLLQAVSAASLLPASALAASAAPARAGRPDARILVMSDMHSAYERMGQVLAAFEAEVGDGSIPHVIALNGDLFEMGNVVAKRSNGVIDWSLIEHLTWVAPIIFNIGNHDNDLTHDLAEVVARMADLGVQVISNIIDVRTGRPYADGMAEILLGSRQARFIGMGTNSITTYPRESRDQLNIPEPTAWARDNLPGLMAGADWPVVMSHAGLTPDRSVLPMLPDGALMIGGHNHLQFQHRQGRSLYVHTGAWCASYTAIDLYADGGMEARVVPLSATAAASPELAEIISATLSEHLTAEETAIIGRSPRAMSLGDSGRRVAAIMAETAGGDVGFIGHTTLGTGFPAGPISRYAFDSVVRFDGKLMVADVDAAVMRDILSRCNQDQGMAFDQLNGDFLYASTPQDRSKRTYRLVTNDWSVGKQREYFGREDLTFREVETPLLKAAVLAAVGRGALN